MLLDLISLFTFVLTVVHGQSLQSPCPDVFEYKPKTQQDRWAGELTVSTDVDLEGVSLKIVLDRKADLLGNWFAESTSLDNKEFTLTDSQYKLRAGIPIIINFFVKYNVGGVVPTVQKIVQNGRTICPAQSPTLINIFPSRPINNPLENENNENNVYVRPTTQRPHTTRTTTSRRPGTDRPQHSNRNPGNRNPSDCGKVAVQATPLITNGQNTLPGQWPWHIALYTFSGGELQYKCGGTLISEIHVVTAAHCVTRTRSTIPGRKDNYVVYLGKQKLISFDGVQDRQVESITVHPNYNISSYANDVAVIEMDSPVETNNFVRPCCLWEGDSNLEDIVGKKGTIVGWGSTEDGELSKNLLQAQLPIVNTFECLSSYPTFYAQFLSESKFCAGYRNGTSACNGDSGGGIVFPKPGTSGSNLVWQLRGIVSVGVAKQGGSTGSTCDPEHYTIFTDVAKFAPWIKQKTRL